MREYAKQLFCLVRLCASFPSVVVMRWSTGISSTLLRLNMHILSSDYTVISTFLYVWCANTIFAFIMRAADEAYDVSESVWAR